MSGARRLSSLSRNMDVDIMVLLKIARTKDVGNRSTPKQVESLKAGIVAYYGLSDIEKRELEDFLKSGPADDILKETAPLLDYLGGNDVERYMSYISERLFEQMGDEWQRKINPEVIRQTIMNLGVIDIYRHRAKEEKEEPQNIDRLPVDLAEKVIKNYLFEKLSVMPAKTEEDFDKAKSEMNRIYRELSPKNE